MIRLAAVLALFPLAAVAQGLAFPSNATLQAERTAAIGDYDVPTGIFADGRLPVITLQGQFVQQAWRINSAGLTTLQLIAPLRNQLEDQGYEILLSCETEACGGFDFRFGMDVLPPPAMYVDLGDYRFLSAARETASGTEAVSILTSRSARAGFIHLAIVGSDSVAETAASAPAAVPERRNLPIGDFAQALERDGHVVLSDLSFETGSSSLSAGPFSSLQSLADYLAADAGRTVALVGHTDAEGSLDGNIALSRRRAASVLERLVSDYGVRRSQLDAQGMGYLSPIATNLTADGREANRRVEVIVTNTQ